MFFCNMIQTQLTETSRTLFIDIIKRVIPKTCINNNSYSWLRPVFISIVRYVPLFCCSIGFFARLEDGWLLSTFVSRIIEAALSQIVEVLQCNYLFLWWQWEKIILQKDIECSGNITYFFYFRMEWTNCLLDIK